MKKRAMFFDVTRWYLHRCLAGGDYDSIEEFIRNMPIDVLEEAVKGLSSSDRIAFRANVKTDQTLPPKGPPQPISPPSPRHENRAAG